MNRSLLDEPTAPALFPDVPLEEPVSLDDKRALRAQAEQIAAQLEARGRTVIVVGCAAAHASLQVPLLALGTELGAPLVRTRRAAALSALAPTLELGVVGNSTVQLALQRAETLVLIGVAHGELSLPSTAQVVPVDVPTTAGRRSAARLTDLLGDLRRELETRKPV